MAVDPASENGWTIRPYGDSDFSDVAALCRACELLVPHNDPAERGGGLGRRMVSHAEAWLGRRGVGRST